MDVPLDVTGIRKQILPGAVAGAAAGAVFYVWAREDTFELWGIPVPGWAVSGFLLVMCGLTIARCVQILTGRLHRRLRLTRRGVVLPGGDVVIEWSRLREVGLVDQVMSRALRIVREGDRAYLVAALYLGGDADRVVEQIVRLREHPEERDDLSRRRWEP